MTSPYLRNPVRTPREAAVQLRAQVERYPNLAPLAEKLEAYADDLDRRSLEVLARNQRVAEVVVSVGALALGSTAVAGAVVTQGPAVGVAAAVVATAASLKVVSEALR